MAIGVYAIVEAPYHGWGSAHTLGFGALSVALLTLFVALEARLTNPILPLRLLRQRTLAGSSVVRAIMGTGMYGSFFLGALYLERVQGYGSVQTGEAFLPWTLVVAALSAGPTARLVNRFGAGWPLMGGLAVMAGGLLVLASAGAGDAYFPTVFIAFFLMGLGAGTSFMPLLTIALSDVPPRDAGVASALINVSLYISGALGLAVLGAIATDRTQALSAEGYAPAHALVGGFQLAFMIAAVCVAACVAVAAVVLRAGRLAPAHAA
jgi:hypothetical protein